MSAMGAMAGVDAGPQVLRASITISEAIDDVADSWSALEASHCVLASHKQGLVRAWIAAHKIAAKDCVFILISLGSTPVALLPLMRRRAYGVRIASWFSGEHFGSYAPLIDGALWAGIDAGEQVALWRRAFALIPNCDAVHLPDVPAELAEASGLAAAFEARPMGDKVHLSRYGSWDACDADRRDKHRRKVDRQQGGKLAARGEVGFEAVTAGPDADAIIDTMFCQRAERFKVQGIRDPFRCEKVRAFYKRAMALADGVLHVLRLDGDVIAVRYNIAAGGGVFSLITSMHPSPDLQAGSPGKQNLLHAMQAVFDGGHGFIEMGKGESDEKRLWCNEQHALVAFSHPLTAAGRLVVAGISARGRAKGSIKNHVGLFGAYRRLRSAIASWGGRRSLTK